jgi:protein ImuA
LASPQHAQHAQLALFPPPQAGAAARVPGASKGGAVPGSGAGASAAGAGAPAAATAAVLPVRQPTRPEPATGTPELPPAVWRADQLARHGAAVWPSGFAALDAQLPGGGWPAGALTELLLPHPGVGELRLLAPLLAALQRQGQGAIWFDPPAEPCAWALLALGLDPARMVLVRRRDGLAASPGARQLPAADTLWALEQALRSGQAGAVLAWLPARLPPQALRRLQLAAQAHEGAAFLLRDAALRAQPSPVPLRLLLASAGADRLQLQLLKRRGPPAAQPLVLALPPVLPPAAAARAAQRPAAVPASRPALA